MSTFLADDSLSEKLNTGNIIGLPRVRTGRGKSASSRASSPPSSSAGTFGDEDDVIDVDHSDEEASPLPSQYRTAQETHAVVEEHHGGTLRTYFQPAKLTPTQQAKIDLALFRLIICAALPFALLDNVFFWDFVAAFGINYFLPDRSAWVARHISQEISAAISHFKSFTNRYIHMTMSFDGWSSKGHDEIYTVHATTPTRRSVCLMGM